MDELRIKNTYVAGGEKSISSALESRFPAVLARFAGADRYQTAIIVANQMNKSPKNVFDVSGEGYADALVCGPVAAKENAPIILVKKSSVPKSVMDYLGTIKPENMVFVDGPSVFSSNVKDDVMEILN